MIQAPPALPARCASAEPMGTPPGVPAADYGKMVPSAVIPRGGRPSWVSPAAGGQQPTPPAYRMPPAMPPPPPPPLPPTGQQHPRHPYNSHHPQQHVKQQHVVLGLTNYGRLNQSEPGIPLATQAEAAEAHLHTHSSKFPVEREMILSEKNVDGFKSKIPILAELRRAQSTQQHDVGNHAAVQQEEQAATLHQQLTSDDQHLIYESSEAQDSSDNPSAIYQRIPSHFDRAASSPSPTEASGRTLSLTSSNTDSTEANSVIYNGAPLSKESAGRTFQSKTYHHIRDLLVTRPRTTSSTNPPTSVASPLNNNYGNGAPETSSSSKGPNSSFRRAIHHSTQKSNLASSEVYMPLPRAELSISASRQKLPDPTYHSGSEYERGTHRSTTTDSGHSSASGRCEEEVEGAGIATGANMNSAGHRPPPTPQLHHLDSSLDSDVPLAQPARAPKGSFNNSHSSGNDSEWVDVLDSEMHLQAPAYSGRFPSAPKSARDNGTSYLGQTPMTTTTTTNTSTRASLHSGNAVGGTPSGKVDYSKPAAPDSGVTSQKNLPPTRWPPFWPAKTSGNNSASEKLKNPPKRDVIPKSKFKIPIKQAESVDGDLTSTTTGLDLDSVLDVPSNSSDEEASRGSPADTLPGDTHAIRRQLEGLEAMYGEVLKLLGARRGASKVSEASRGVLLRRRLGGGSVSSLPSSVSSRPMRDKRRHDDKKKVKDLKGINKRFQRLESHVVTLARSVAHLSSEMRTQHLMIQEIENIHGELAEIRANVGVAAITSPAEPSSPRVPVSREGGRPGLSSQAAPPRSQSLPSFRLMDPAQLANPTRVKKLTHFFGDEPPLLRIFLRRLGYEKYACSLEAEKVGLLELPYLSEDRLQRLGIPLGPRLRILQEAHAALKLDSGPKSRLI